MEPFECSVLWPGPGCAEGEPFFIVPSPAVFAVSDVFALAPLLPPSRVVPSADSAKAEPMEVTLNTSEAATNTVLIISAPDDRATGHIAKSRDHGCASPRTRKRVPAFDDIFSAVIRVAQWLRTCRRASLGPAVERADHSVDWAIDLAPSHLHVMEKELAAAMMVSGIDASTLR